MRTHNMISAFLFFFVVCSTGKGQDAEKPLPPDEAYVTAGKDGHLYLDRKRIRFWGAIGKIPGQTYEENISMVERLKNLGFNMVRYGIYPEPYMKGDGSKTDRFDHFLHCCQESGIKVWYTGLNKIPKTGAHSAGLISDKMTEKAWKEAVELLPERRSLCWAWDPRIREYRKSCKLKVLNHLNQYTGYRYGDDPVFAVFELSNEEWWFHRMKRGQFLDLPEFFRKQLIEQWNQFLEKKYKNDEGLKNAWAGNLLSSESLANNSVLLLPVMEEVTDEQAAILGVETVSGSLKQTFSHDHFNGKRAADVIRFLLDTWLQYKQAESDAIKSAGKAAGLIPLVWDTGIGWDLPTQFMQQHADAIAHDSYWNGSFHTDPHHKRFPWVSQLEELPKTGWDDPWLEHNKMEGKPFFVYETQILQPAKYRAEYPMEIVKLASIQDWDIINWHYWGAARPAGEEHPYDHALDYARRDHYTQGYHYQFDEVQQSSMTLAGEVFKNFLLSPAAEPTEFVFGSKSLYSWDMNGYGKAGLSFLPTVYRYGMRLKIDPSREEDQINGPVIRSRGVYEACPIEPTGHISHDWQKGHLIFDAPGVTMYTGFFAQYGGPVKFSNGITLKDVVISNPPNMPYPVKKEECYIEFCLASGDGRPIHSTKKAWISLVSTSFNSGFEINERSHATRPYSSTREWTWDLDDLSPGDEPVLVARAGAVLEGVSLNGLQYRMLDWHFAELKSGRIEGSRFEIPAEVPVFLIELWRNE